MTSGRRTDDDHRGDEPLLRRWSRRKQQAREGSAGTPVEHPEAPSESPTEPAREPVSTPESAHTPAQTTEDAGADLPTDADMPPIESLNADSDYSQFMSPRVSESLRRMALRKLFGAPAFNLRDGLDDYDEDFTRYQSLGDTITSDMKFHARRRARLDEQAEQARQEEERDIISADDEMAAGSAADADASDEHDDHATGPPLASADDGEEEPTDDRG